MRLIAASVAALVLVAGCSTTAAAPLAQVSSDWPTFRGDAARDGHPAGATLTADQASRLKVLWTREPGGSIDGSPVVSGHTVVAATEGGTIAAYDLDSGAPMWTEGGLGKFSGSPAVAGDLVVAATLSGHVYALKLATGRSVWDWSASGLQPAIWSSPAVFGQSVLIGIGSQYGDYPLEPGKVAALDLSTGRQKWLLCVESGCAAGGGVWSSVAVDSAGRGFVGTGNPDDGVLAFEAASGNRLWATSLHPDAGRDLDVGATPIVVQLGGREAVAVGSDGGVFALLDAGSGAAVWSRFLVAGSAVHGLIASPAYDGASFYVPSASTPTGVFALDPATGAIQWEKVTDLPIYSAPAVGSGVLVFGTGDVFGDPNHVGGVEALSTSDGAVLWSYDTHAGVFSAPAIAGTTVIVGDANGLLLAFRPG